MNAIAISQDTVKVLIVDDQKIVRETICLYLEPQADFQVVGCVDSGMTALEQIPVLKPDVVIVDLEMPGISGITTMEILSDRFPEVKSLVLSSHDEKHYIRQAVSAGARGYFLKGTSPNILVNAVRQVHQGYFQLGEGLLSKLSISSETTEFVRQDSALTPEDYPETIASFAVTKRESQPQTESNLEQKLIQQLQYKLETLETKKAQIQQNYSKLKRNFSWLVISQIFLLLITAGLTSSWVKLQLEATHNQAKPIIDISQLTK